MSGLRTCTECLQFKGSTREEFERHVIVDHRCGFGTLRCQRCGQDFYDYQHFKDEHTKDTSTCTTKPYLIDDSELSGLKKKCFDKMLEVIMGPIDTPEAASAQAPPCETTNPNPTPNPEHDMTTAINFDQCQISTGEESIQSKSSRSGSNQSDQLSLTVNVSPPPPMEKSSSEKSLSTDEKSEKSPSPVVEPSCQNKLTNPVTPSPKSASSNRKKKNRKTNDEKNRENRSSNNNRISQPKNGKVDLNENESHHDDENEPCTSKQKLLNLCQWCVELEIDPPPRFTNEDRKHHVYVHMKCATKYEGLTEMQLRAHEAFQTAFKSCFQEGFYEELKRDRAQTSGI